MTRNEINVYLASIISTIAETGMAPASVISMAIQAHGASFSDYMQLQYLLVSGGVCTLESDVFRLTESGKALAVEIDAAAKAA